MSSTETEALRASAQEILWHAVAGREAAERTYCKASDAAEEWRHRASDAEVRALAACHAEAALLGGAGSGSLTKATRDAEAWDRRSARWAKRAAQAEQAEQAARRNVAAARRAERVAHLEVAAMARLPDGARTARCPS